MPTLWDNLNDFQALVARVQAQAANPKDKQLLGQLLQQIKGSQAAVQKKLPALLDDLQSQAEDFKRKFEAARKELDEAMQKAEALEKQAAEREALEKQLSLPKPKTLPTVTPDPQLGKQLRSELLAKFEQSMPAKPAAERGTVDPGSVKEEVFEGEGDGSRKPAVADEWPKELRTPSTKSPSRRPAPKPSEKPTPKPSDDESIGRSWSDEDE